MSINKTRIAQLLGPLTGGGELQKLTITTQRRGRRGPGTIEALFNPNEITLARSALWEQQRAVSQGGTSSAVVQEFRYVEAETFDIELFFDTYESRSDALTLRRAATDVRRHTDRIAELVEPDRELHQPPLCRLRWGTFDIFTGVFRKVQQRFTLFLEDGTPVRATLTCAMVEVRTEAHRRSTELHSSDVARTRLVRRTDTLQSLAAEEYQDPGLWRHIARANGIVNPRTLLPGTVLTIPKLRPEGGARAE
jgi:nucleoid-associated protein YgaU